MPEKDDITALEKHGQTVLAAALLAAITWMGGVVLTTNTDVKVLSEKISGIDKRLDALSQDRFTRSDAAAEVRIIDQRFKALETRVRHLEKR